MTVSPLKIFVSQKENLPLSTFFWKKEFFYRVALSLLSLKKVAS